ncbi:hypothetical protein AVEN_143772-1 [Araneus ventricosus]|uniref:Uncharacterized protein n=1 Tax=Araneus ventricosus TaxID=182803 RepID=A0A4Y2AP59_ARAVE|nr:hypothetical protein AVEN_143772-1 [Araneus ventricosus]
MRTWRDQSYSQRVSKVSLPHRCLSQDDRKYVGRDECDFEGFQIVSVESAVSEMVSLAKIMNMEVDKSNIIVLHSKKLWKRACQMRRRKQQSNNLLVQ